MSLAGSVEEWIDTRKTIPGLRRAQKYAVRCGGCGNHRMGLYDAILLKENHIHAAGSIASAISTARTQSKESLIEIEVESLAELNEALASGPDMVLLDNFDLEMIREAVSRTNGKVPLEASGNVSLGRIRKIAQTGVDYISVGALTKNIEAVDLSMRFRGVGSIRNV